METVVKKNIQEEIQEVISDTKYCPTCKKNIDKSKFYNCKKSKDGLRRECKICKDTRDKNIENNKIKIKVYKNIILVGTKYCPLCKKDIDKNKFAICKYGILYSYCLKCTREKRNKSNNIKEINLKDKRQLEQFIEGEIWKPVLNYELLYECSNLGRIRNLKRKRELKPFKDNLGYLFVSLNKNLKSTHISVHRIIALTFIENLENKYSVNHINKIRNDNRVCNLEWNTQLEQVIHMHKNKIIKQYIKRGTGDLVNLKGEIWKHIPKYDNYEISNLGRLKYPIKFNNGKIIQRITYGAKTQDYLSCILRNNDGNKFMLIHRLVAEVFLSNLYNKKIVNHKNGDKHDNTLINLEWTTHSENSQHAINKNLNSCRKKINQYNINGNFIKTWDSINNASQTLNINGTTICSVLHCKGKTAGSFIWKYSTDIHKRPLIKENIKKILINKHKPKINFENKINSIKINQIDVNTNKIIKSWNSITEASYYLTGTRNSSIYRSLKDNSKISLGFKWQYAE